MFTGLIETTGTILSITPSAGATRITVASGHLTARLHTGDSVAVNGTCLTDLELPTPAGSPLGGHVVQGHVDGTATLMALEAIYPESPASSDWRLRLTLPEHLVRYVVPQGSITVEGISLTIASLRGTEVEIAVIPHTYAATNLHTLTPGSPLNIETDVLARYAEQQSADPSPEPGFHLSVSYLLRNGY